MFGNAVVFFFFFSLHTRRPKMDAGESRSRGSLRGDVHS